MQETVQQGKPAVDIDGIALDSATNILALDPAKELGGGCLYKARIQCIVRDALDSYRSEPPVNTIATDLHRQLAERERLDDQTMRDRDHNADMADQLANGIAAHLGIEIGEHSNMNDPWANALEAIESAPKMLAQTTFPCRSVRFTFTHPTIGDGLFVPLVDDAMRVLLGMNDEPPVRTPTDSGVVVTIEPLDMVTTPEQDAQAEPAQPMGIAEIKAMIDSGSWQLLQGQGDGPNWSIGDADMSKTTQERINANFNAVTDAMIVGTMNGTIVPDTTAVANLSGVEIKAIRGFGLDARVEEPVRVGFDVAAGEGMTRIMILHTEFSAEDLAIFERSEKSRIAREAILRDALVHGVGFGVQRGITMQHVDHEAVYQGPERRQHATEDPAASDPQPQHKPAKIPGAVWPDPAKSGFNLDGPDKFNRSLLQDKPLRRHDDRDLQDER
jgi:hypothetical protein